MRHASSPTLLCYDGSSGSKHAVAVASKTLATDEVVILHSWNPPVTALADSYSDFGTPVADPVGALEAREAARAREIAAEGVQLALSLGLIATMTVQRADGDEWRVILDTADAIDAGLVVLGTRGRTAVQDGLLGTSVSSDVLHHSMRPVLIVPLPVEAALCSAIQTAGLAPAAH